MIVIFVYPGLIVGAILRYSGDNTSLSHMRVVAAKAEGYKENVPPDTLWFKYAYGKCESYISV